MRKILTAFLAAAVLLSAFTLTSFAFPDIENSKYITDINELNILGIMTGDEEGNFNPHESLTRAEFAKIITTIDMEGMGTVSGGTTDFKDFDDSHWGFSYIYYVASRGYMRGYGDGTFRPDECITGYEAVKVLLSLSGYEYKAVAAGGYPVGYEAAARSLGMLSGITVDLNEYLYRDEIAKIINNTLDLNYVELVGVSSNLEYKVHSDKTILSEKLGVKRGKGRVLATDSAALGVNDVTEVGKINIDGMILDSEVSEAREYLGYKVKFMYRFDKEDEDIKTLISIENDRSKVLTIKEEDFVSLSGGVLTYESGDSTEKVNVSQNADYILNGSNVPLSEELFENFKMGEMTLISDGSSVYDAVIITSWKIMEVDVTDTLNKVLRDKFNPNFRINLDEETDKVKKIYKDGKEIDFSGIKQGDIITAAEGKVSSVYYVTSGSERGIIEGYDEDYIYLNGNGIKRNYYFLENYPVDAGKNVTVKFDYFGNAAAFSVGITEGESLAYLVKLKGKETAADTTVFAKLFFEDGSLGSYTFANDIYVNGEYIKNINEAKLLEILSDEEGEYAQLLKVKLAEGLVKGITLARAPEVLEEAGTDGFCLMYEEKERVCQEEADCYDYEVYIDENTKYFQIPEDAENADAKEFKILDYKPYFTQGSRYVFTGYTESKEDVIASAIVPRVGGSVSGVWEGHDTIAVISSVSNIVDEDGEQLLKFHVFKGRFGDSRMEADVFVSMDEADSLSLDKEGKYTPRELKAGDVIVLKRGSDDFIELFRVVRKYSTGVFVTPDTGNVNYVYEKNVTDVKGSFVFTEDSAGAKATYNILANTYVILVSESNGIIKVNNGTVTDIVPEDYGIFQITSRVPMTVVVFK